MMSAYSSILPSTHLPAMISLYIYICQDIENISTIKIHAWVAGVLPEHVPVKRDVNTSVRLTT